ncbi:hypothetical protein HX882_04195 [Pseudomonas gingeri]|uniref:Delta-60 repeat domain-containing protein n=1 Tax=Pseudomonas gingeri TaxID=117681 RepID=A0A7Y7X8D7_9PSED|nr:hypothetical protein [Pseudomonas gingeri]NWB95092.1 hypothetical protein [Pseudomonas gingeri]
MENSAQNLIAPGSLDSSFGFLGNANYFRPGTQLMTIVGLRPQGEILFVGYQSENNQLSFELAQLNEHGHPDTSFGEGDTGNLLGTFMTGSEASGTGAQILKDGKIMLLGLHIVRGQPNQLALARFLEKGQLDETFGDKGVVVIPNVPNARLDSPYQPLLSEQKNNPTTLSNPRSNIVIDPDGKIIIVRNVLLMRRENNGEPDLSFNQTGHLVLEETAINAIAVSDDRKITIAGSDSEGAILARFNADGSPDLGFGYNGRVSFGVGYPSSATCLFIHDDGRIFAAGVSDMDTSDVWGNGRRGLIAAFSANGRLDPAFNNGAPLVSEFESLGSNGWWDIGGTPDEIVVVGEAGERSREGGLIARYLGNGSLDTIFGNGAGYVRRTFPGLRGLWESGLVQPDRRIVVTGDTPQNIVSRYLGT